MVLSNFFIFGLNDVSEGLALELFVTKFLDLTCQPISPQPNAISGSNFVADFSINVKKKIGRDYMFITDSIFFEAHRVSIFAGLGYKNKIFLLAYFPKAIVTTKITVAYCSSTSTSASAAARAAAGG